MLKSLRVLLKALQLMVLKWPFIRNYSLTPLNPIQSNNGLGSKVQPLQEIPDLHDDVPRMAFGVNGASSINR